MVPNIIHHARTGVRSAPGTLDSSAYPHILDAVVACSDYETLLAFRLTSKAMCEKIDRDLFEYVIITSGPHYSMQVLQPTSPYRRLPFLPWGGLDVRTGVPKDLTDAGRRMLAETPAVANPPPSAPSAARLVHTRVVDFYGTALWRSPPLLPRLEVVRRLTIGTCPPAPTVVDYFDVTAGQRGHVVPNNVLPPVPGGTRRWILHFAFNIDYRLVHKAGLKHSTLPHSVDEIDIVLEPYSDTDPIGSDPGGRQYPIQNGISVLDLLTTVTKPVLERGGQVRFIGLERIPISFFKLERPEDNPVMYELQQILGDDGVLPTVQKTLECVVSCKLNRETPLAFVDYDTWRDGLPSPARALVTQRPEYVPPSSMWQGEPRGYYYGNDQAFIFYRGDPNAHSLECPPGEEEMSSKAPGARVVYLNDTEVGGVGRYRNGVGFNDKGWSIPPPTRRSGDWYWPIPDPVPTAGIS